MEKIIPFKRRMADINKDQASLFGTIYKIATDLVHAVDIKKLNAEIEEIVAREETLREKIATIINEIEVTE